MQTIGDWCVIVINSNQMYLFCSRFISDNARKLDECRGCASSVSDLFTPSILAQRSKLRENCEKLIFLDPILYGRKGEEMLWRKVYYDIVSTSKRLKKKDYTNEDISHLQCHINAGIGYYHHFISRLEIEYNLNLNGIVDFSITNNNKNDSKSPPEWVELSIHRCLIFLGDLTRYKLEIYPNWDPGLAIRYYLQAANFKPEYGMPHNQLGTLSINLNYSLDSTYHYLRCLNCKHVFEGTENNLIRLFEKNNTIDVSSCDVIKRLVVRFLSLIDTLYFEKKPNLDSCHEILLDLQMALNISKPIESPTENYFDVEPSYLNSDIIFKMTVILLMCVIKLEKSKSNQISIVKAFLLALYSQLLQTVIVRIETSVFNVPIAKSVKLRRRRKKDCDQSDCENETESETESDNEFLFNISDSDYLDTDDSSDEENAKTFDDPVKKVKKIDPNDLLEIFQDENLLQAIKIISDYLFEDITIIKTCSSQTLQKRLIHLLNLINLQNSMKKLKNVKNIKILNDYKKIPLVEDVILKKVSILKTSQKYIDWEYLNDFIVDQKQDMLIRIYKMVDFGFYLTEIDNLGISYDKKKKFFYLNEIEIVPTNDVSTK